MTTRALLNIGFIGFTVNINDRRILRGMLESMGFAADQLDSVCISFDKLDKIGADGVKKELPEKQFGGRRGSAGRVHCAPGTSAGRRRPPAGPTPTLPMT